MKNNIIIILLIISSSFSYTVSFENFINDILYEDTITWEDMQEIAYWESYKTYNPSSKEYEQTDSVEFDIGIDNSLLTAVDATGDSNQVNSIKIEWDTRKYGNSIREVLLNTFKGRITTKIYLCDTNNITNDGAYHAWLVELKIEGKRKIWLESVVDPFSQGYYYYGVLHLNKKSLKSLSSFKLCENENMTVPTSLQSGRDESSTNDTLYSITINNFPTEGEAEMILNKLHKLKLVEFGKKYPKIESKDRKFLIELGLCNEEENAIKISKFFKRHGYNSVYKRIIFNELIDENFYQCPHIYLR